MMDASILYTFYNTPEKYFLPSIKSAVKFNLPILIVNDQSDTYYLSMLKEIQQEYSGIEIVTPKIKLLQQGCTYYGASLLSSKYIIRMDSDDIMYDIPHIEQNEDYDLILNKSESAYNIERWLCGRKLNINGCFVKKEILKFMYADYQFMNDNHFYFHEDDFTALRLFLLREFTYKIEHALYRNIYREEHRKSNYFPKAKFYRTSLLYLLGARYNINIKYLKPYFDFIQNCNNNYIKN